MDFIQQSRLVSSVQDFVTVYFEENPNPKLLFHQIHHTKEVVEAVKEISGPTGLCVDETEIVTIAAWLHDIGYCHTYREHEPYSTQIAIDFLQDKNLNPYQFESILNCIKITKLPQQPVSLIQKVICDADFYHFSRTDYIAHADALRLEWEINLNLYYADIKWNSINYVLLRDHQYFTTYGRDVLQARKDLNIQLLRHKILK